MKSKSYLKKSRVTLDGLAFIGDNNKIGFLCLCANNVMCLLLVMTSSMVHCEYRRE